MNALLNDRLWPALRCNTVVTVKLGVNCAVLILRNKFLSNKKNNSNASY